MLTYIRANTQDGTQARRDAYAKYMQVGCLSLTAPQPTTTPPMPGMMMSGSMSDDCKAMYVKLSAIDHDSSDPTTGVKQFQLQCKTSTDGNVIPAQSGQGQGMMPMPGPCSSTEQKLNADVKSGASTDVIAADKQILRRAEPRTSGLLRCLP